ncbi:hypothetical protein GF314_12750 [bacterium]|nr:hypothetical protein [bacterium]
MRKVVSSRNGRPATTSVPWARSSSASAVQSCPVVGMGVLRWFRRCDPSDPVREPSRRGLPVEPPRFAKVSGPEYIRSGTAARCQGGPDGGLDQGSFVTGYRLFQPNRRLGVMLAVSLLVHALLWVLVQTASFGFLVPRPSVERVELVLADDPPLEVVPMPGEMAADETPRRITLMPERLAGEEPEQADFLADVSSRAADLVPGGEAGAQPRASRESDVQAVQIREETADEGADVEVSGSVMPPPQPATRPRTEPVEEDPVLPTDAAEHGDEPLTAPEERDETTEPAPDERPDGPASDYEDWVSEQRAPSLLDPGERANPGDRGFEFDQVETGNIETNVDIVGGYRLNTYAWNFAPWIRRFANDLQRSWIPPYAYRLGLIDGRTEVRVVVERDGRPSRMDVLSSEGHESLHTASVSALKACAPYLPLPPDFPEDKLVIVFTLIYPEWRR